MKYIFPMLFVLLAGFNVADAQSTARKGKDYAVFFYVTDYSKDYGKGWDDLPETKAGQAGP